MKRVLAALVAAALVAGAFAVRTKVIDHKSGGGRKKARHASGQTTTLACAPELMAVCEAAAGKDVQVLPDPLDLSNAAANASKIDAWLTYGPAPDMVNAAAGGQSKLFESGTVVAAGRVAAVAPADRAAALARYCRVRAVSWACLVRAGGAEWPTIARGGPFTGSVKVGVGQPSTALGSILLGPAALATARSADPGIDEIDVNALSRLVSSVNQSAPGDELLDLTTQGPAAFSVVIAPEGVATRRAQSPRGQGLGLVVLYPDRVAKTVIVLSAPDGREVPKAIVDALDQPRPKRALADAGWNPTAKGSTSGLPAPDVLYALNKQLSR